MAASGVPYSITSPGWRSSSKHPGATFRRVLPELLKEKDITFKYTADVPAYLAKKGHGGSRGARDLRNLIRKEIEDEIANIIIDNADTGVAAIAAEIKEEKISFSHL